MLFSFVLFRHNTFLIYLLFYIHIKFTPIRINFSTINFRSALANSYANELDSSYLQLKNFGKPSISFISKYWSFKTNLHFDYATNEYYVYNYTYNLRNKNKFNFRNSPHNALPFVNITNTTWLMMRTNHFYIYYDYIDIDKLSFNQT